MGKFFLTSVTILFLLSVRIFEQLTFECRWWNNANQDKCKTAFNTFAAGSAFNIMTMLFLFIVAVYHGVSEGDDRWGSMPDNDATKPSRYTDEEDGTNVSMQ